MSARHIFLLGQNPDEKFRWAKFEGEALVETGWVENEDGLSERSGDILASDRVTTILPGEQVAFRSIASPSKSPAKFSAAAHYLLEDELGESINDLHVVTVSNDKNGAAFAVKMRLIDSWLAFFRKAGIELDVMTADYSCLPIIDQAPTILLLNERTIVAVGQGGFSAENSLVEHLIPGTLEMEALESSNVYGMGDEMVRQGGPQYPNIRLLDTDGVMTLIDQGLKERAPGNLLQGKFKKSRDWRETISLWRRPAILAASLAVFTVAIFIAEGIRDLRIANTFERRSAELLETYFPNAEVQNFRAYANEILSAKRGASFQEYSAIFTQALDANPEVRIDRLRYDDVRGQFVISVRSADDRSIENLRSALLKRNLRAEDSGGYRRLGSEWAGDMVVGLP